MLSFEINDIIEMQGFMKTILGIFILSNFIIIFAIRMQIRITNKFKAMFKIKSINSEEINKTNPVLLIIAHPDDEIMFWTPTIKYLIKNSIPIKILCLSNGNYNGLGKLREKEFEEVSKELKMEDNQILNLPELQDNITMFWDEKIVSEKIEEFLNKNKEIKTIITFDENGVTKHPNHISCYNGLEYYIKKNRALLKQNEINIFLLDTLNPIKQYTFLFPFILFYFKEFGYYSWNFHKSYTLMKIYKTQFNFLRKLHTIFSGYSYFNSFTKVEIQ